MFRNIVPLLVAVICFLGCSSTTVHIDYDREVDRSRYKTFAWALSEETSMKDSSPLMHDRTVAYITQKLEEGGLAKVEGDPDVYVTYHTDERQEMQLNTTHLGYGYGRGYYRSPYWGGGMEASSTRAYTYARGTLIIDIWDAETKNLVWRGAVENAVSEDPQEAEEGIYNAIDRMVRKWQSMKK